MKYLLQAIIFTPSFCKPGHRGVKTCCSAGAPISSGIDVSNVNPKTRYLQMYYEFKRVTGEEFLDLKP